RLGDQELAVALEHRDPRAARTVGTPRAPAGGRAISAAGAHRPGRAHRASAATVFSATPNAVSTLAPGLVLALTSGEMPAPSLTPPPPRLCPLGVKYSPTVKSSAPPLGSGSISWKTPLPYVCVPITLALPRSCRAPVTISAAEAVPRLTSTTI